MSGVLVLAELLDGAVRPASLELIGAGRALSGQGAGPLTLALIGPERQLRPDALPRAGVERQLRSDALPGAGVEEIVLVPTPGERFEAHVWQAAVEGLIAARRPSVVLAGHTLDALGFAPAVAARAGLGFASDVTGASWGEQGLNARRSAYGERLVAELDFPGKQTVLLLLRAGAFQVSEAAGAQDGGAAAVSRAPGRSEAAEEPSAPATRLELDLDGRARTEWLELREPQQGEIDIAEADFLLSIGRGVKDAGDVPRFERLAELMGAVLSASGPLVEAGWMSRARKVGRSGRTVAPRVYLALGISGAAPHLAGMSGARTIIAVNTDPNARIFDVAHYGAAADLFEIAAELERQLG
jgi:electron transfer flavoprotein alpha subunit